VWFFLWAGLILVGLLALLVTLRWLWRQTRGLMEALAQAERRLDGIGRQEFTPAPTPKPALEATGEELGARLGARRERIEDRGARRRARNQLAYSRWAVLVDGGRS
jgi:hypothetical protein